jgi:hypothetical protein
LSGPPTKVIPKKVGSHVSSASAGRPELKTNPPDIRIVADSAATVCRSLMMVPSVSFPGHRAAATGRVASDRQPHISVASLRPSGARISC